MTFARQMVAEGVGTAYLLAIVVGSGIMGEQLAGGNAAIALLANSIATGCGLWVLIVLCGPLSGAHFNPAVTLMLAAQGQFPWRHVVPYIAVHVIAAFAGVIVAHAMFDLPLISYSVHARTGVGQWTSEIVATSGLLMTIVLARDRGPVVAGGLVAAFITAAYWFTASTSFANPAVTLARAATGTFAGIRVEDVPGFIVAQLLAITLVVACGVLLAHRRPLAKQE